jgi:hypothetical protein
MLYKKSLKIPKGGNQNPYIEEEQTTQWPKEKVQKDKQRSTKHKLFMKIVQILIKKYPL